MSTRPTNAGAGERPGDRDKSTAKTGETTKAGDSAKTGPAKSPDASKSDSAKTDPAKTGAHDSAASLRRTVYMLLAVVSIGAMLGRLMSVNSVDKIAQDRELQKKDPDRPSIQRPFLSGNDRSRWDTMRSLVEHGTYKIDAIIVQPNWDTIDMVKHDDEGHGVGDTDPDAGHLYSSKPPLLATLLAGEYWVIHRVTGWTLGDHPYEIGRFILATTNIAGMALFFAVMASLIERLGWTHFGRMFAFAAAAFGTLLSTFSIALNNHLFAAISAAVALWGAVRIILDGNRRAWVFLITGIAAAFAAACDLPALSFFALISAVLLWRAPKQAMIFYLPGALLVAAAFFGTNYAAHGQFLVPYAQRSTENDAENWYKYSYRARGRVIKSYWQDTKGIDVGEADPATYALHLLVGHHGIFSLTPVWILAAVGLFISLFTDRGDKRWLTLSILLISAVCIAFFLARPQIDRNYSGTSSGFRWLFWLAPLWLVAMLPAVDRMANRRLLRGIAYLFLAMSVFSASYPTWNPWTHPWLLNFLQYLGVVQLP